MKLDIFGVHQRKVESSECSGDGFVRPPIGLYQGLATFIFGEHTGGCLTSQTSQAKLRPLKSLRMTEK